MTVISFVVRKTPSSVFIWRKMLKIIVLSGNPIAYPVDPNAIFEPGMIAQLKVVGDEIVVGVSDGSAPFGIIDDIKTATADSTAGTGKVTVWLSNNGIFKTDQFDTTVVYPLNGNLYSNPNGKLTTSPPNGRCKLVAIVTRPPTALNPTLEFLWIR